MDSKQRILNIAEALFMKYGIKSVTMDDVSRELGISKKTLYQFVDNKKDLIAKVMHLTINNEMAAMVKIKQGAKDAIDEMLGLSRHVTQLFRQMHPGAMYDLQKYYRDSWQQVNSFHEQYIYAMIKENIEKGQGQGLYRTEMDSDIIAKLYVGKTMLIVDESTFPLQEYDRQDLFLEYINYHIRGIASTKGLKLLEKYSQ